MAKDSKKAVEAAVKHVTPSYDEDMGWRADSAMHTIMKAEEHKADKPLMKAVKAKASSMSKAIEKCCGK